MKFAGIAFSMLALAGAAHAATPPLLPMPAQIQFATGSLSVADGASIVIPAHDAATRDTAQYLVDLLARTRGLHLKIKTGPASRGAIVLSREADAPVAQMEGYTLDVTPAGIRINARDAAGLFYGAITLSQLLTPDAKHGAVSLAAMHISDQPRFAWRGLMLDSARHFQSVADVERLLDQMAQHKLNVFHWHLTDDQGWRIQIKRYPELTRIGAWRTLPGAGRDGEPMRYGGFYTQDDIRKVVAFASVRHITVVPELDMPGHAQAAVASYPQLGVTGKRPPVSVDWGVNPYLYNVDDATLVFIHNVLDEVMALFPSHDIHVGGDEAVKDQWQASATVQAKMHALGIHDEDAMQGWLIDRIGEYLAKHGRRLVGWDEILEGGHVQPDAIVMSWRGTKGAIDAAKSGHDVVLSPAPTLYFDQLQSARLDETTGRMPVQDLASIYAFDPVPKELDAAQSKHVLGAQANVWTEHMPSMQHVEHAVFPRIDALSEVDWSPASTHDWKNFLSRLPTQLARYRAQGIGYADSAFAVDIAMDAIVGQASDDTHVTLSNLADLGAIHYTTDGSTPTLHSPLYKAPFDTHMPTTVRAASFTEDGDALAAPRTRLLDRASLLDFDGNALANCPDSSFRIRVQPTPDATSMSPVYSIDLFDTCQMLPSTRMDGLQAIHFDVARLERNYALAHEQVKVIAHPHATPYGEIVVHDMQCNGAVLATLPLPDPQHSARRFRLDASLPKLTGDHALCLQFTAPIDGPLYATGHVTLVPAKGQP
ncbi:family 20 glycosylhydrolase [Rhodanobacter sp. L36]|uniref:beta-N-acetylhexosaminidase n=1 Tax=Rhodanobacter sp. L36 TaxID=1747221 RepID=UPI00131B65BD|nr:family 20 glycosylhydrolase [Rhodanobacter sp. L36]